MYLRFVVKEIDEDSHEPLGVFQAAIDLRDDLETREDDRETLRRILRWFDEHLEAPDRFSKSTKVTAEAKGISWFKKGADDCIDQAMKICVVLRRYGIETRMLKTKRVGYVLYEDEDQVCAMPFRGMKKV